MKRITFALVVALIALSGAYAAPPGTTVLNNTNASEEKSAVTITALTHDAMLPTCLTPDVPDIVVVVNTAASVSAKEHVLTLKKEEAIVDDDSPDIAISSNEAINNNTQAEKENRMIREEDDPLEIVLNNNSNNKEKEAEETADVIPIRKTANPVVYQNTNKSANH